MGNIGFPTGINSNVAGTGASAAPDKDQIDPNAAIGGLTNIMAQGAQHAGKTDAADVQGMLDSGRQFVDFGFQAVKSLGDQISKKTVALNNLQTAGGDPNQIQKASEQLDLMNKLRDSISYHMERIQEILNDADGDKDSNDTLSIEQQLRALQQNAFGNQFGAPAPGAASVASTYKSS